MGTLSELRTLVLQPQETESYYEPVSVEEGLKTQRISVSAYTETVVL